MYGTMLAGGMIASAMATHGLVGALRALRSALISTGIGALAVLLGELTYQILEARRATDSWGDAFELLVGRMSKLWEAMKWSFYALVDYMKSVWSKGMASILTSTEKTFGAIAPFLGLTFGGFGETISELNKVAKDFAANAADQFGLATENFSEAVAEYKKLKAEMDGDGDGGGITPPSISGSGAGGKPKKSEKDRAAEKLAREMEQRLEVLKESHRTEEELSLAQYAKDLETLQWHLDQKKITEQEYLDWKARVTREHEDEMQQIRLAGYAAALGSVGDMMGSMAQVIGGNNEKMLKAQRIFAAASALIDTYAGAAKALTLPFPANLAAAATVMAKGMALVAAIKSGSKSSASGGGSVGNTQTAAPQEKPQVKQMAEIKVHGEVFDREAVIGLIEKINDVQKDGHVIKWSTA